MEFKEYLQEGIFNKDYNQKEKTYAKKNFPKMIDGIEDWDFKIDKEGLWVFSKKNFKGDINKIHITPFYGTDSKKTIEYAYKNKNSSWARGKDVYFRLTNIPAKDSNEYQKIAREILKRYDKFLDKKGQW